MILHKSCYIGQVIRNQLKLIKSLIAQYIKLLPHGFTIMDSANNFNHEDGIQHRPLCRICLEEDAEDGTHGSMVTPCYCKGTAEHVHTECMINWIKRSFWRTAKDANGTFILCELCKSPIYFNIGSESWFSWYKSKPCSAVFYLCWILLLFLSFTTVAFLAIYAIITKQFQILRFLGLPLGVFGFGGFLFCYCGKDFRDYQTNIVTIKQRPRNERKSSVSSIQVDPDE